VSFFSLFPGNLNKKKSFFKKNRKCKCGANFCNDWKSNSIYLIFKLYLKIIIQICIFKFCASASYAIIYLYSSELFPTSIRNSCMGSCSMMARIGAITAPFIIGLADSLSSPSLPFLVFGVSGILGSLTALILPETLNRELPQKIHDADLISKFG
jgi:hypothetical protein